MAMLKPSQSYSGGGCVDPYTGNIAQDLQFLSGEDRKKKKTNPIFRLGSPGQPIKKKKKTKPILRLGSLWQPSKKKKNKPILRLGCSSATGRR